jgi:hypothetical protein
MSGHSDYPPDSRQLREAQVPLQQQLGQQQAGQQQL